LQKKSFFDKKQKVCRSSYGRVGSGEVGKWGSGCGMWDVGCGVWDVGRINKNNLLNTVF
jgi:hypothetical protein